MLHLFFGDFKPPRMPLSAEVEFVLQVTFGTSLPVRSLPPSMSIAVQWARDLGILEQFAQRLSELPRNLFYEPQIQLDFGSGNGAALVRQARINDANERLRRAVLSTGVDVVLLDAPVLVEHNQKAHVSRASDVFALVPSDDLQKVSAALVDLAFSGECCGMTQNAFRGVNARETGTISFQHELPFVRMVPGGLFVDVACLKRCGLLEPLAVSNGSGLWRPSVAVLVAFLLAQALVEFRFVPECNLLRLLLATSELAFGDNEDLAFDAYLLVQTDIEHAQFEAWRELTRALTRGELEGLSAGARVLLNHALAVAHSSSYRLRLRAQHRAQKWQHDGTVDRLAATVGRAINRVRGRP
jgi:hypothetical protein